MEESHHLHSFSICIISASKKWLFALEFYGVSAVLSVAPAVRGMTPLSMSIAWQLAGTAGIWEYGESEPGQATEVAGLKNALDQLGKLKNFSWEAM